MAFNLKNLIVESKEILVSPKAYFSAMPKDGGYADARPWLELRDDGSMVEILIATTEFGQCLVEIDAQGEVTAI